MSNLTIKTLLTTLLVFTQVNAQCGGSLPFSDTITCGTNNVYTPKSFTSFDTTATKLTIVANIQITDTCSSTAPLSIFSLTLTPSGTTTKKILDYQWTGDTNYNTFVEDTTGSKAMTSQSSTTTGVSGVWTTFLGTVDLRGTTAYSAIVIPGLTNWNGVYVNNLAFGNTWTFDSTTKIYICSSTTGANAASCTVKSLDFWYDYLGTTLKTSVLWGVQPLLIGNYRFQSQSGSAIIDTTGGLGTAYFGASTSLTVDPTNSPSWIGTEPGITFTATNQYVKIPTFTLQPTYGQSTASVTINFWIKPSSLTNGFIFRYSPASLASNIFSISLTSAGLIKAQIGSTSKSTTAAYALSTGTWTLVTVSYVLQTVRSDRNLVLIYINGVAVVTSYDLTVGTITFTPSTDVVRIGGPTSFLGDIKELSIYSPGSLHVNSPSYCSTSTISCEMDLGKTFPPTCISCPEGTALYNSICLSCPAGQYLSSTNDCVDCPVNCETCTSATSCQSCSSGYSLYNSECITCETGEYSDEGTCVACPATCVSCTSGSKCQSCNAEYGLYQSQSQCVTCPLGTYLSSGQECLDCAPGCTNCTSKSECQKCASGYILSGLTCEKEGETSEGTAQGNNPTIFYATTSVGLALGICGLTGIIMTCFSSPNVSSSVHPVPEDDVSKLITIKPSDETVMGHSNKIRLKDIVNKRKLKTTTTDFTDDNSPGL